MLDAKLKREIEAKWADSINGYTKVDCETYRKDVGILLDSLAEFEAKQVTTNDELVKRVVELEAENRILREVGDSRKIEALETDNAGLRNRLKVMADRIKELEDGKKKEV